MRFPLVSEEVIFLSSLSFTSYGVLLNEDSNEVLAVRLASAKHPGGTTTSANLKRIVANGVDKQHPVRGGDSTVDGAAGTLPGTV